MGSAFEMPALRGKGAELFAKRQSRMEKYVVDSDTVQANKALGRSSSLSPPVRLSPLGLSSRSASVSPSPRPSFHATYTSRSTERQAVWSEKSRKPPTPWEAASRHPLGLVDEAFDFQDLQHSIATNLRSAAHRKLLPEPPADWKAKVAYEPPSKSQSWGTSRLSLPFLSPTKSTASAPAAPVPYGSPLRQSQPPRSITEANLGASLVRPENKRILGQSSYKSTYSYTWRRFRVTPTFLHPPPFSCYPWPEPLGLQKSQDQHRSHYPVHSSALSSKGYKTNLKHLWTPPNHRAPCHNHSF
ncbi:hypothetical protein AOLI_G00110150 [Acnodon oligacanthus]